MKANLNRRIRPNRQLPSKAVSLAVGLLVVLCAFSVLSHAQSGRRAPRKAEPAPEATPEPTPVEKSKTPDKPNVGIMLGINGNLSFANVPAYFYDIVLSSCAEKLREAPSISLDVSGHDMNRGDAVKLAKSQKDTYVAFLELKSDTMSASSDYDQLAVEYTVFAPETGKIVTSGKSYQRQSPLRSVIPKTGRGSSVYAEQMLKQAGRDAAQRILSALHLSVPRFTASSSS